MKKYVCILYTYIDKYMDIYVCVCLHIYACKKKKWQTSKGKNRRICRDKRRIHAWKPERNIHTKFFDRKGGREEEGGKEALLNYKKISQSRWTIKETYWVTRSVPVSLNNWVNDSSVQNSKGQSHAGGWAEEANHKRYRGEKKKARKRDSPVRHNSKQTTITNIKARERHRKKTPNDSRSGRVSLISCRAWTNGERLTMPFTLSHALVLRLFAALPAPSSSSSHSSSSSIHSSSYFFFFFGRFLRTFIHAPPTVLRNSSWAANEVQIIPR